MTSEFGSSSAGPLTSVVVARVAEFHYPPYFNFRHTKTLSPQGKNDHLLLPAAAVFSPKIL